MTPCRKFQAFVDVASKSTHEAALSGKQIITVDWKPMTLKTTADGSYNSAINRIPLVGHADVGKKHP